MSDVMIYMSALPQPITTTTTLTAVLPVLKTYVIRIDDMHNWTDTVTAQGHQLTELLRIVRAYLVSQVIPVEPTTTILSVLEILIVSVTTTTVLGAPKLPIAATIPIPSKMFSVVVLVEIPVNATLALTEKNRKKKRGNGLQKSSEGSSSFGFEIPVTTVVPYVYISPLAPTMVIRFLSISLVVMVPPTFAPDFTSRPPQIVHPLQEY
ncbi:hypothetical protein Scep_010018 [Stephania cephalantha]|uniref:Uncharacterized protein n=1 Tax=Stephania cephalantha TaxID=152367 RepID=A0AAP0JUB0_9MAGN